MFSFNAGIRRTGILLLILLPTFQKAAFLQAETNGWRHSSSIDFNVAPEIQSGIDEDLRWLGDADRLMEKLTDLDVQMYTLISNIGNDDSRRKLIEQRGLNRKLIYDLLVARNDVIERLEDNRYELN